MLLKSPALASRLVLLLGLVLAQDNSSNVMAPCDSQIFCQGPLLRDIQLAEPFADSKTFVDLPTIVPVEQVLAAYNNLSKPITNNTALQNFLATNFGEAGQELGQVNSTLITNPTFLSKVNSSIVADFTRQVIDIWPTLTRTTKNNSLCAGCDSSFIPLNRTFVVAGGRFREAYYWDSFFILEGLLRTQGNYTEIAKNTIENFLDLIDLYGFVPNGGRKYYLNRSQPPLLSAMIQAYMDNTNDTSILQRALPLLEREQEFFEAESVNVVQRSTNYTLYRYAVPNNQPRPESYLEDYQTANNATYFSLNGSTYSVTNLSESTKETLYANLASGAESGWDYSSRWLKNPLTAVRDDNPPLRSLNTENIAPVDLQSIQYQNAALLSSFYTITGNRSQSSRWRSVAATRRSALNTFHYNTSLNSYFDYNLTSGSQITQIPVVNSTNGTTQRYFSPAQFYPFALNATPTALQRNASFVLSAYRPVIDELLAHPGGVAASNIATGQQWDSPNVWPPLQYFLMKGLLNTLTGYNASAPNATAASNGIATDTADPDVQKVQAVAIELAQRYVDSTYCTWRSTGGAHPLLNISRLPDLSPTITANGTMFEKYSNAAIDLAGGGGEYEVVPGFGWTNGVLIWTVDTFGDILKTPDCDADRSGNATSSSVSSSSINSSSSSGSMQTSMPVKRSTVHMVEREGRQRFMQSS